MQCFSDDYYDYILGKTTLADSLVASNGIISHRQAGKVCGGSCYI